MGKSWEESCWCKTRSKGRGREMFKNFTLTEESVIVTNAVFPGDVCVIGQASPKGVNRRCATSSRACRPNPPVGQ